MMTRSQLGREDLIRGINAVIMKLRDSGESAGIRIVGGAALALRYFDRKSTSDIDALLHPVEPILRAALEVANEQGWPDDWLNSNASMFVPSFSVALEWEVLFEDEYVTVLVASPEALLAMKIYASRPGRDELDIANLLSICGIRSVEEAEELMDKYYIGDAMSERALELLESIFVSGLPQVPKTPPTPFFRPEST